MASVEQERHSAQQELLALHKQAADDKRAALTDTNALRQATEEREARVQVWASCTPSILATMWTWELLHKKALLPYTYSESSCKKLAWIWKLGHLRSRRSKVLFPWARFAAVWSI